MSSFQVFRIYEDTGRKQDAPALFGQIAIKQIITCEQENKYT